LAVGLVAIMAFISAFEMYPGSAVHGPAAYQSKRQ
jgi:hypothetical protein